MKLRSVNTAFWADQYVERLDPSEKLLYLYFMTNPLTELAGVYKISIKRIAFETGFSQETVETLLKRFRADKKIWYEDGWIIIKNYKRHQNYNPKMLKNVETTVEKLPANIKELYNNITLDDDKESADKFKWMDEHRQQAQEKTMADRILEFKDKVISVNSKIAKPLDKTELFKFCDYWTEHNENGRKFRAETHKIFDIARRLGTWRRNNEDRITNKMATPHTGRVVTDAETKRTLDMLRQAEAKIKEQGTYDPSKDETFQQLKRKTA